MRIPRAVAVAALLFIAAAWLVSPVAASAPQGGSVRTAGAAPCGVRNLPPCPPGTATLIGIDKQATPTSLPVGGGSVTYTYQVPNVGGNPLINITVTDDKCAPVTYVSGDVNNNSTLEAGETWTFTCTTTITTTTTNTATAKGFDQVGLGTAAQASATVTVANCPSTAPNCTPPPCHDAAGVPIQCPSPTPCIPGTQPGAVPCPSSTPGTSPCPPTVPNCTPPPCLDAAGAPTQCPSPTPCAPITRAAVTPCPSRTPGTSPCPPTVPNCTPPPSRTPGTSQPVATPTQPNVTPPDTSVTGVAAAGLRDGTRGIVALLLIAAGIGLLLGVRRQPRGTRRR